MKKLVILSLVLGIASLATAGLSLTADGVIQDPQAPIELKPSDYIMLGIHSDVEGSAGETGQYDALLVITDPALGTWTGVVQLGPAAIPDAFGVIDPEGDGSTANIALFVNSDGIPTTLAPAGLGAEFEFHCEGEGDVVVLLVDTVTGAETPYLIVQTPEPATMGLLALGGLFLRRRK